MKRRDGKRRLDPRQATLAKAPKDHVHLGLCLLYSGSAFRGLQLQAHSPTSHTLEGVLLHAMKDAGVIADVVRGRPAGEQHHFARACRTDRGVHAIRNLISLFVPTGVLEKVGGVDAVRDSINVHLPATMRVAHVMPIAGNFIPRHSCNRRVYRYMLPLYALLPPCDTWAAMEKYYPGCFTQLQALTTASTAAQRTLYGVPFIDVESIDGASPRPASDGVAAEATSSSPASSPSWVQDVKAKIDFCNHLLATRITGSRRYHNFSVDVDSNRSSVSPKVVRPDTDEALRVIYRCEIQPRLFFFPCATDVDGELTPLHGASYAEYTANTQLTRQGGDDDATPTRATLPPGGTTALPFVFFQIEGGSFLLNMIRKIVGSLLAVCRGAREAILDEALNPERRVSTPLAPGPYLYLAQSTYHGYDRSLGGGGVHAAKFTSVKDAWAGAVDDAAEKFAFQNIAADVVDVDLNAMPPLDDMLAARDGALAIRRPHTATEDAHLTEMKEFKPVLPSRTPWLACSEMTIFLRLLRVHNWNVRQIRLDPDCKALREVRNREERAVAAAEEVPTAEGEVAAEAPQADDTASRHAAAVGAEDEGEVPYGGTDGWLYPAASPEDAVAQCQAYFASRWKRARPWEYGVTAEAEAEAEAEVGGEEDVDDDEDVAAPSHRRPRK